MVIIIIKYDDDDEDEDDAILRYALNKQANKQIILFVRFVRIYSKFIFCFVVVVIVVNKHLNYKTERRHNKSKR